MKIKWKINFIKVENNSKEENRKKVKKNNRKSDKETKKMNKDEKRRKRKRKNKWMRKVKKKIKKKANMCVEEEEEVWGLVLKMRLSLFNRFNDQAETICAEDSSPPNGISRPRITTNNRRLSYNAQHSSASLSPPSHLHRQSNDQPEVTCLIQAFNPSFN